jgi:excisionase family DNA binding protein
MTVTQTTWTPASATAIRFPARPAPSPRAAAPEPSAAETLMTLKDVAAACKLSETAIRRAISEGELPAVKLRSRLRIVRQDYDHWIAGQRQARASRATAPADRPRLRRRAAAGSFRALAHADLERELQG